MLRPIMCLNIRWSPSWHASCSELRPTPYSAAQSSRSGAMPLTAVSLARNPSSHPVFGRSHRNSYMDECPLATTAWIGRKPVSLQRWPYSPFNPMKPRHLLSLARRR